MISSPGGLSDLRYHFRSRVRPAKDKWNETNDERILCPVL